jgi:hypothetical protein
MLETDILDADLKGMTLLPGIYNVAAAIDLTGDLILDAAGVPNAEWTFNIGGALTIAADSKMIMINGGQKANVHWEVVGAITLGADSVVIGNMNCGGVFSLGTGTIFTFDDTDTDADVEWTFNIGGALTTEAHSKMVLANGNTVIWNVVGAITLGVDSVAIGEMNSGGTITVGSGASCGALTAAFGAITMGEGACTGAECL